MVLNYNEGNGWNVNMQLTILLMKDAYNNYVETNDNEHVTINIYPLNNYLVINTISNVTFVN